MVPEQQRSCLCTLTDLGWLINATVQFSSPSQRFLSGVALHYSEQVGLSAPVPGIDDLDGSQMPPSVLDRLHLVTAWACQQKTGWGVQLSSPFLQWLGVCFYQTNACLCLSCAEMGAVSPLTLWLLMQGSLETTHSPSYSQMLECPH